MSNFTTISRDPFARHDVIRQRAEGSCFWCGNTAKYRYGLMPDSGREHWMKGVFCNIDCARTYHQGSGL